MLLEGTDSEVSVWMQDGIVDVAVVATLHDAEQDLPEGGTVRLKADQMVAVLARDHPLAEQTSIDLRDLTDDALLLSDGGCEPLLVQMHRVAGITLRPSRKIRDMTTLLALVREGLGVTVVPELAITDPQGLTVLPINPATYRALHLVAADSRDVPATVQVFLDIARSVG